MNSRVAISRLCPDQIALQLRKIRRPTKRRRNRRRISGHGRRTMTSWPSSSGVGVNTHPPPALRNAAPSLHPFPSTNEKSRFPPCATARRSKSRIYRGGPSQTLSEKGGRATTASPRLISHPHHLWEAADKATDGRARRFSFRDIEKCAIRVSLNAPAVAISVLNLGGLCSAQPCSYETPAKRIRFWAETRSLSQSQTPPFPPALLLRRLLSSPTIWPPL